FLAVAQADPLDLESQAALGKDCINFGAQFRQSGQWAEALKLYQTGEAIYQRLTEANPSVTDFQEKYAFLPLMAGEALRKLGRPGEPRGACERRRNLYLRVVEPHPDVPAYQSCLATDYESLAGFDRAAGRLDQARSLYDRAQAIHEELSKKSTGDRGTRFGL